MMEQLRRDAPGVADRHDAQAAALQQAMDPRQVLAALDEPAPGAGAALVPTKAREADMARRDDP